MAAPAPPRLRGPATLHRLAGLALPEAFPAWVLRRYSGHRCVGMRLLFIGETFVVSDPGMAKEVFTADRELLRTGEANRRVIGLTTGPQSVLLLDGDRHLAMRRLLLPPFHGEAVRAYGELVERIAREDVERWPVGRPFPTLPRMKAVTLEVILRSVIGVRDEARLERLRAVLPRVLGVNAFVVVAEGKYPRLTAGRLAARLPWVRARREVTRLLHEEIAAHRASPEGRDDVLALLVAARDEDGRGLDDDALHDQLMTLLLAGHETTAAALAWAFELLVRHPAALARLEQEVLSGEGDAYTSAVVNETLRLRPPLEAAWRALAEPLEIGGYTLPAGATIALPPRGVGRRDDAWDDPYAFRPERLLGRSPLPYTLIPFGGGPRRCLGASLALMEMKTVLRVAIKRFRLQAPPGRPERQSRMNSFTTVPSRGGRVVATARPARPAR